MMTLVTWLGPVLELGVLTGLILRRRLSQAATLPLLLFALVLTDATVALYPQYNTWDFWLTKEFVHAALFLLLALELSHKAFADPAAHRAARRWVTLVIALTILLIVAAPHGRLIVEVLPRLMGALAWLYLGLAVVMLRYNARIAPLHDAILTGFAPYLIIYAATWNRASESTSAANIVNPLVFFVVLIALARAAWSRPSGNDAPWLARRLRPSGTSPDASARRTRFALALATR